MDKPDYRLILADGRKVKTGDDLREYFKEMYCDAIYRLSPEESAFKEKTDE